MKKVLFFLETFSTTGGGPTYCSRLINIMNETRLFDIMVIEDTHFLSKLSNREPLVDTETLKFHSLDFGPAKESGTFERIRNARSAHKKIKKLVKEHRPDIVIVDCFHFLRIWPRFTFRWLRRFRKRMSLITVYHHYLYQSFTGLNRMAVKHIENYCLKRSDNIIFSCPPTYETSEHIRESRNRLKFSLPLLAVEDTPLRGINKESHQICYVGNVVRAKGILELIQSLGIVKNEIPNVKLKIAGTFNTATGFHSEVEQLVTELNLQNNVDFLGTVSDEVRDKLLDESMAFVFPSFNEGYGIAMVEAMKFSLPVIAWDISAMPYTVKHEQNGLLVPPNDIKGFADAIVTILNDSSLRDLLSKGARSHFESLPTKEQEKESVLSFLNRFNAQ